MSPVTDPGNTGKNDQNAVGAPVLRPSIDAASQPLNDEEVTLLELYRRTEQSDRDIIHAMLRRMTGDGS